MADKKERKAIVVGISGCSSSGKTTLARLLREIFPNTFVLHEDDFYREEKELPTNHGFLDWDCAEALNMPNIAKALSHIQKTGELPPDLNSKEDRNSLGHCPVSDSKIAALKEKVAAWTARDQPGAILTSTTAPMRICVFDGFLLYSSPSTPSPLSQIQPFMDLKLFLRVSESAAITRRKARSGYVTIEGFWEDPPGYVETIVWGNYVRDHAWMFEGGNVEGRVREDVREGGIRWIGEARGVGGVGKVDLDVEMESTLEWAVGIVMEGLVDIMGKKE